MNFVDQHRVQRQQPLNMRETKGLQRELSHISPLHQDSIVSSGNEPEPVKPVGTAAFSFGTARTAICSEATQFTRTTTISAMSPFSTAPAGFGSAFPCHSRDWKIQEGGLFNPLPPPPKKINKGVKLNIEISRWIWEGIFEENPFCGGRKQEGKGMQIVV